MVAPSAESAKAPAMPPASTGRNAATPASAATVATAAAPEHSATDPSHVTPPESPVSTGRNVRSERGRDLASVPISVPHVSAAAAANAPAKAAANGIAWTAAKSAQPAAIPPLATTWTPSRAPCLPTSISARLRTRLTRESAIAGMKNAKSTAAPWAPSAPKVHVPIAAAPHAPLGVSVPARSAATATADDRSAPARSLVRIGVAPRHPASLAL